MRPGYIANPTGSTLLVVLLVIMALTILGMVTTNTTVVELEISRSHRELRENFYLAEAVAMEGIQRLLNSSAIDRVECFSSWHHTLAEVEQGKLDLNNPANWHTGDSPQANALQSPLDPHAFLAAAESRVAGGSSLVVTDSRLYVNRVYGLCTKYNADNLVQIGYYMRY
jgi:hypothetical protein